MTLEVGWSFAVWKNKLGEGRVRPGSDQSWEWPSSRALGAHCLSPRQVQAGVVVWGVEETPKASQKVSTGGQVPCGQGAGAHPGQQRDSGPAMSRVATRPQLRAGPEPTGHSVTAADGWKVSVVEWDD